MNRFDIIRRWYLRLLETLEEMALATVARIVPWLIPIAPAWAIKSSVETYLHVDPLIALLMALAFEGMGIYVSHVAFLSWAWNKSRNKSDPIAPFALMVALVSVYLIVGGILVLLIKIYPPSTVFAPAAFLPLGLVVYTAWATHLELTGWRSTKEDEALDRKVRSGLKAEIKRLTEARDALSTACNALTGERDILLTECTTLTCERDTLTAECHTLSTTRSNLLTQVNNLAHQVDTLTEQLDTLRTDLHTRRLQLDTHAEQPDQTRLTPGGLHLSHDLSHSETIDNGDETVPPGSEQARPVNLDSDGTARETRLETIVNLFHAHPDLKVSALADHLDISRTTLYRDLNTLQDRGLLHKNGSGWEIVP